MKVQGNKMDSIRMNYWGGHRNFGDELSPYLVEKITGKKVIHASQKEEDKLIALGSIVDFNNIYSRSHIWGSGVIGRNFIKSYRLLPLSKIFRKNYFKSKVYATRGPRTREVLMGLGFQSPEIYGDPAILLPKFYQPKNNIERHRIGIVLHQSHKSFIKENHEVLSESGFRYISIYREGAQEVEKFVDELCSCDFIFSTSLHGVIVAQAYGIPVQWMKFKAVDIHQDDEFKFNDYFLGANAEAQKPFFIESLTPSSINDLSKFKFKSPDKISSGDDLLQAFPNNFL